MWDPQCGILTEKRGWSDNLSREYCVLHRAGLHNSNIETSSAGWPLATKAEERLGAFVCLSLPLDTVNW